MTSVIVTVFEQLRTLEVLLECLEKQQCAFPWEVLVSDDGSTSNTLDLVRRVACRGILDIRYLWQPNRGFRAGAARNNGIRQANGDVLIFLDGDMLVESDFVTRHTAFHNGSPLLVCGTRVFTLLGRDDDLMRMWKSGVLKLIRTREPEGQHIASQSPTPWIALLSCNFSVRRSPEVRFDEGFVGWGYEDREFAYRLIANHGYVLSVSSDLQGVHVCTRRPDAWQPLRKQTNNQQELIALLRNMLYFADLHPSADLSPMLLFLQTFHLDPATDRWYHDRKTAAGTSIAAVREWFARNRISLIPVASAGRS